MLLKVKIKIYTIMKLFHKYKKKLLSRLWISPPPWLSTKVKVKTMQLSTADSIEYTSIEYVFAYHTYIKIHE